MRNWLLKKYYKTAANILDEFCLLYSNRVVDPAAARIGLNLRSTEMKMVIDDVVPMMSLFPFSERQKTNNFYALNRMADVLLQGL